MKLNKKIFIFAVALLLALPTIPLGRILWPEAPSPIEPAGIEIAFFVGLFIFEAISFGAGIAFVLFAWPLFSKAGGKHQLLTKATFVSIAWSLFSWWPHDHLHAHNGENISGLLMIEYGFHVTLIIAAIITATFFYTVLSEKTKK